MNNKLNEENKNLEIVSSPPDIECDPPKADCDCDPLDSYDDGGPNPFLELLKIDKIRILSIFNTNKLYSH